MKKTKPSQSVKSVDKEWPFPVPHIVRTAPGSQIKFGMTQRIKNPLNLWTKNGLSLTSHRSYSPWIPNQVWDDTKNKKTAESVDKKIAFFFNKSEKNVYLDLPRGRYFI